MSRNLPVGLIEEANATETSRVFHLVTVEIYNSSTTGTIISGSVGLDVVNSKELTVGMFITISGAGEGGVDKTVKVIDIAANVVTIDSAANTTVNGALVTYNTILHLVDSNYDVKFGGVTYLRFPLKFSEMSVSTDGTIDKASLSIGNVSREIMYYVEQYDGLRNRKVWVKTVFEKFLAETYTINADGTVTTSVNGDADPSAYIEDIFTIDSYAADENVVNFQLDPAVDFEVKIPRRRFTVSCYFKYRGDACGYTGPEPTGETGCAKTLAACKARNNSTRFGGFMGIDGSSRRLYL